ncbi:hypothetical protein BJ742DRAFT_856004 [Cladochytrium replicatum]|nr:hypothetical protein BJ742DRAFT_856004 [Cladochytrium replicatum]
MFHPNVVVGFVTLLVALSAVSAQQTSPPPACAASCSMFTSTMKTSCAQTVRPSSNAQTLSAIDTLAKCICPYFAAGDSDACLMCLNVNAAGTDSTLAVSNLKSACYRGDTAGASTILRNLFGVTATTTSTTSTKVNTKASPTSAVNINNADGVPRGSFADHVVAPTVFTLLAVGVALFSLS